MQTVSRSSLPCSAADFSELSAALLDAGVTVRFLARGWSMSPLLRDGDVLLVQPLGKRALREGDIVLCPVGAGSIVVHRVVRRRRGPQGPLYTVQGDQVRRPDGVYTRAQIYGRVAAFERGGARVDLQRPALRALGWVAVWRSRWDLARAGHMGWARGLVKRLPGCAQYLDREGEAGAGRAAL